MPQQTVRTPYYWWSDFPPVVSSRAARQALQGRRIEEIIVFVTNYPAPHSFLPGCLALLASCLSLRGIIRLSSVSITEAETDQTKPRTLLAGFPLKTNEEQSEVNTN